MSQIRELLDCFKKVATCPGKIVREYREKTGKGAVGCFPVYTPEEIPHAAGMLPVGMWGGETTLRLAPSALPSFACSIMQSITELQLQGVYDSLVAVIVSSPCDTLKAMGQKWRRQVPCIQFAHSRNTKIDAAADYTRREYQSIRARLEAACATTISDEAIQTSVRIYNEHRQVMREFSGLAASHPDLVNPIDRHMVMKSAFFMRKENHTVLVKALNGLLAKAAKKPWEGVKIIVSGIMLEPVSVLEVFKQNQIAVVGDDLAQESRQYRVDAPEGADPLDSLARQWLSMYGCSLIPDPEKSRFSLLRSLVEQRGADGIVLCVMKFCEPEEFDYPPMKAYMEKNGINLLQIEIDQQIQSVEQIRTRIQSFAEILRAQRARRASIAQL
ncbi:MAG: 2-hydroxyacyl-CoA dehydratase family protein [Peptococcaceae bacterium]|jgi:benzoyl-CoA reductase/2-hydroxyglutaryl-CoA dehydratase subunit BcrC/BadD/HgdB|nr:2-hydroxyacyl-CoA dehydratase family protein [Peptococcaceae bacterium]